MKIKLQILIILSALFFTAGFAHASYNMTGLQITGDLLTWTNTFSGSCVPNFYYNGGGTGGTGGSGGGGYWGNSGCSSFNGGIHLNSANMPQSFYDTYYFQMNNYNGIGNSNQVPIYWTGTAGVWSLTYVTPPPAITVTSPANNSTITSNSTTISGSYPALNAGTMGYGYLRIWFQNQNNSSITSQVYSTPLSSGSGTFSFPLSALGITQNGNWIVKAQQELDANTFQDLTPSPTVTFNLNIPANSASSNFIIASDGTFSQTDIGGSSLCYYSFSITSPHTCANSNIWAAHNCNSSVNLDCPVGSYMQGALCGVTTPDNEYLICNYGTNGFGGSAQFSYAAYKYSFGWTTTQLPTSPTLTVSGPTNGTTITSTTTTISGTYASLNSGTYGYGYLKLWFVNPNNNISSQVYTLPLSVGIMGTFSTPLSTFGITENGTWNLKAQQELDANTFQDLTPTPTYALNFNISGNSAPYTFTDWNTWYTQNAAGGYSAPSDFANSIEGFFQPIFTNVYEFANQTLAYFNATTAYDKGNQIGLVFPTTQAYLNKINIFFGGFPLVPFFEFLIVVMLGIFIVRTIFKFIPFFG
ncbi:MAG: hypothetical protein NTW11_00515 [Candidatus Staskawiczbacteria bacterium]|nr:hypothetical protein [Candidatus Staskawiczbacteria bacterium]